MNENKVTVNDFTTLRKYIKYLCKQKKTNLRKVAEALDLNYVSISSNIGRTVNLRKIVKVIEYLDGDLTIALHLPLKKENKSTKKGKMNYDND